MPPTDKATVAPVSRAPQSRESMRTSPDGHSCTRQKMGVFLKVNLPPARVPGKQDFAHRLPDERPQLGGVAVQPCGKLRIRRNGDVPAIQNNGFAVPALRGARVVEVYRNMPKQLAGGRRRHDQHGLSGRGVLHNGIRPDGLGVCIGKQGMRMPADEHIHAVHPPRELAVDVQAQIGSAAMTMFTPCARKRRDRFAQGRFRRTRTRPSLQGEAMRGRFLVDQPPQCRSCGLGAPRQSTDA